MPKRVFLLRNGEIKAMASYNKRSFAGFPSLIIEGICLDSSIQGRGIFREITNQVIDGESAICLRTQNPRMYKALANYCSITFPGLKNMPEDLKKIQRSFAKYLKCDIDNKGVIRGYYGELFYGTEPEHCSISRFFKQDLEMALDKGDAVLAIGLNPSLTKLPKYVEPKSPYRGCCYDF